MNLQIFCSVIKLLLLLSHGQASVERDGFLLIKRSQLKI